MKNQLCKSSHPGTALHSGVRDPFNESNVPVDPAPMWKKNICQVIKYNPLRTMGPRRSLSRTMRDGDDCGVLGASAPGALCALF